MILIRHFSKSNTCLEEHQSKDTRIPFPVLLFYAMTMRLKQTTTNVKFIQLLRFFRKFCAIVITTKGRYSNEIEAHKN